MLNPLLPMPLLIAFSFFFFALGLCIGSFLNVVIWRLPNRGREVLYLQKRGPLTLSWPPSHCPVCDAPIRWFQNIPIFSYIFLRGRCANCRTHIPIRYPLVELSTGVAFLALFLAYFYAGWQPGFFDIRYQWPLFIVHLIFISALLAASAIDADLFIIPLSIPWMLVIVGLLAAGLVGTPLIPAQFPQPSLVTLADSSWWLAKPIIGGTIGLILANLLLALKIIPRSFSEETMQKHAPEATTSPTPEEKPPAPQESPLAPPPKLTRFTPSVLVAIALLILLLIAWCTVSAKSAAIFTLIAAILIFLIGILPRDAGQIDVTDEVLEEISAPYVRREALKESLFLAVPIATAVIAYYLPFDISPSAPLARILGCLLGILVGGGLVWAVRIAGTLAFNKEAMGMGDAHLMAGVGAILGAPLVVIAFFTAPFLGILWALLLLIFKKSHVLPYGPWLSVASILALFIGNPLIAWYLSILFHRM